VFIFTPLAELFSIVILVRNFYLENHGMMVGEALFEQIVLVRVSRIFIFC
jgi:hypothetical protein